MGINNYAVVYISGKQYIIQQNQCICIDFVEFLKEDDIIRCNKVLLLKNGNNIQIGKPYLNNTVLLLKVTKNGLKGNKIIVLKTRPKKHYTRKRGHRQLYTQLLQCNNNIL